MHKNEPIPLMSLSGEQNLGTVVDKDLGKTTTNEVRWWKIKRESNILQAFSDFSDFFSYLE